MAWIATPSCKRARNDAEYVIEAGVENFMQQSRLDHGVTMECESEDDGGVSGNISLLLNDR